MKQFLLTLFTVFSVLMALGQAERITTINGKKYIIHTVEAGNTVYSISKKYAVDESFIVEANPYLEAGLKVGQEIKIPLDRRSKSEAKTAPDIDGEYLIHTVNRKETLYSISKRYGIEIKEILDLNPLAKTNISVGQRLKIPATRSKDTQREYLKPADTFDAKMEDLQKIHYVQPKETLYSLAREYGVTMRAIMDANGGLPDGLKIGQALRIPKKPSFEEQEVEEEAQEEKDTETGYFETFPRKPDKNPINFNENLPSEGQFLNNYKVAVMLPFLVNDTTKGGAAANNIAVEFFRGMQVALDSLKAQGLNLTVMVYDSQKDPNKVRELLLQPQMANVNLFIGPMFRSALEPVIAHAQRINAHVVCPVPQSNEVIFNQPHVSKVHPTAFSLSSYMGMYVAKNAANANVLLVGKEGDDGLESRLNQIFRKSYFRYRPGGQLFGVDTIATLFTNGYSFDDWEAYLDTTRANYVFTPSNDPVLASALMTHLKGYVKDYEIHVLALESWLRMDKIDTRSKMDLNLKVSSSVYTDYSQYGTRKFLEQYRNRFFTEPETYGYLGFDITYYYLMGLHKVGLSFLETLPEVSFQPTSKRFNYVRLTESSGFENKAAYIVSYNDYKLKLLN